MRKVVLGVLTLVAVGLVAIQCKKKETTTNLSTISGTATRDSIGVTAPAGGAVITLSTQPNAAAVIATTIADATGKYTFGNIPNGTYYIDGKYNTANTNLKDFEPVGFTYTTKTEVTVAVSTNVTASALTLVSTPTTGTVTSAIVFGSDTLNNWQNDMVHSQCEFSFAYDSINTNFTGSFGSWTINKLRVDLQTPANDSIDVTVDITNVDTRAGYDSLSTAGFSHARDGIMGCIASTLGIKFIPIQTAADTAKYLCAVKGATKTVYYKRYNDIATVPYTTGPWAGGSAISCLARFQATPGAAVAYGDGFAAPGTLSFNGKTDNVVLYFHYIEGYSAKATKGGGRTIHYASIYGNISFDPVAGMGINASETKGHDVTLYLGLELNHTTLTGAGPAIK